jgi:hypothetical protein
MGLGSSVGVACNRTRKRLDKRAEFPIDRYPGYAASASCSRNFAFRLQATPTDELKPIEERSSKAERHFSRHAQRA